ncbi:hypothetical protein FANTH_6460 [Fusarium anthophilum]|uniref:Ankyrin n=1 Tax=Fusarium anthophilum TaxID=48485 RepID=A0A8H5E4W1_9HYPO|nr:hypothetical protein FANTH_6460 [Fusarium anthophilum]
MSKKRLQEVVENTPSGLDRIYDQNWSRIMNMSDRDRDRTFALLRWTAFALIPLPIYAAVEAVLIDQFGELDLDEYPENVDDEYITSEILGLCGPLVEIRQGPKNSSCGSCILHVSHFSVRQYLAAHLPSPVWMQPKDIIHVERERIHHTAIAKACIQYLSLPQVWDGYDGPDHYPKSFLIYATYLWAVHGELGFLDPSLKDLSKAFLKSNNTSFQSFVNFLADLRHSDSALEAIFQPQLRAFEYVLLFGWIDMADSLIDDIDVNEIGVYGRSPIFSACDSGSAVSVDMLIRHGADLSITDDGGSTCLHDAACQDSVDILRILVEANIDLSPQNNHGLTPLHLAAAKGNMKAYRYLLGQGADTDIRDLEGGNVIHHTCSYSGNSELLRFILQNGPDTLATDHLCTRGSPLFIATGTRDIDMAKVLFEFGAVSSLFHPAFDGKLPLHLAASSGDIELVKLFLDHGAWSTLSMPNMEGNTPLHLATSLGDVELVELLLDHGAESTLSMPNADGNTALHVACAVTGRDKIISLLLQPGVEESILMGNKRGNTPLHVASEQGYASYVNLILQYSEPGHHRLLEMKNNPLQTSLHLACNAAVVRELLNFGAQTTISVCDKWGRTPLHFAAFHGDVEAVKILLKYGAENTIDVMDDLNGSPLFTASIESSNEVIKELLSHGAGRTITASIMSGMTPLHAVASRDNVEGLKFLLDVPGVPVNQRTSYGFSPLFIASRNGFYSMVELLLSAVSVDKNSENWLSLSPLFAAVANGHLKVTKLLLSKGCHAQHQVKIGGDLLWWAQRSKTPGLIQLLKTQDALSDTASGLCNPLPDQFTNIEPLPGDAETVNCTPHLPWCYVCTLSNVLREDFSYVRDHML